MFKNQKQMPFSRGSVERASETLENVKSAWVKDQNLIVENGKVSQYRVVLKVTSVLTK